jgi:threonine dehydratase
MSIVMDGAPLIELSDVREAAARLEGVANRTPLLRSRALDARCGGSLLLKAECFQRTGSFKFRGAYNALSCLEPAQREPGVCSVSSGNHSQALALAAKMLGIPARC